jgi:uncharacterized membrane protein YeiH
LPNRFPVADGGIWDLSGWGVSRKFRNSGEVVTPREPCSSQGIGVRGGGGGTTRDLLLGTKPVFWIADQSYLLIALGAGVLTMLTARLWLSLEKPLLIADALGLSLFTIIGAQRAMESGAPALVVVLMGVVTGVAGGIIRDVLAGELPYVFRSELYAIAAMAGAAMLLLLDRLGMRPAPAMLLSAFVCLFLRYAGIRWKWRLPIFSWPSGRPGSS